MPQLLHTSSQPAWAHDIDAALIHGGLLKAPRLLDTLHCWTGTWVGQVSFYRPLSSYVFWFEWKLFGERDRYYALVAVAAHIAATVLFGVLADRLGRRWRVWAPLAASLVAAAGFAGLGIGYRAEVVGRVAFLWKNQPDSFTAICFFCSPYGFPGSRPPVLSVPRWLLLVIRRGGSERHSTGCRAISPRPDHAASCDQTLFHLSYPP